MPLRACLHRGGGPQAGEVARLAVVVKWPTFTYKLKAPWSRGDVTRRCYVVARHVNRENGGRTTHFGGQCSFPLIICSRCNILVLWLFTVTFDDTNPSPKAVNCNTNSTLARRVKQALSFIPFVWNWFGDITCKCITAWKCINSCEYSCQKRIIYNNTHVRTARILLLFMQCHRVTSRAAVSSNQQPVFFCLVSYFKGRILSVCFASIEVIQANSQCVVIIGFKMVKIVVSKQALAVQISKSAFVGFRTKIEVNRAVQTSLKNCPTSTVRAHVTQHLYWFSAIWTDRVHSTGCETNLEKFGVTLDGLC